MNARKIFLSLCLATTYAFSHTGAIRNGDGFRVPSSTTLGQGFFFFSGNFENLSDGTTLNITATNATIKGSVPAADAKLKLIGTFNEVVITDAEELAKDYYISGDKFRQATSSLTVKPFRAYFTTTSGNNVKMFNLSVLEEEETAIDNIQCSMLNAQSIYDANGMKQTSLRKGLNIMKMTDGSIQKVMVK